MLNIQPLTYRSGSLIAPASAGHPTKDRAQSQKFIVLESPAQAVTPPTTRPHQVGTEVATSKAGSKTAGAMSRAKSSESDWAESEWNPAHFERVVEQFQIRIHRFIYGMVGETELAHDLTQDTFVSAYKNLCKRAEERGLSDSDDDTGGYGANNMSAWLYTIARNAALSEMRRRKVVRFFSFWQRSEAGTEDEIDGIADTAVVEPGGNLEARTALRDELERAMDQVGRERLTALLLHMDGFSYKEICQVTGDSLSSVKSQIFRAKDSLRRSLTTQNQQYQAYLTANPNQPKDASEGVQD